MQLDLQGKAIAPLVSLSDIAARSGYSITSLQRAARRSETDHERRLKLVGKRNRVFHIPAPALKALQRKVLDCVLAQLPVHEAASCVRGKGVIWNAQQHLDKCYVSLRDIRNCFPSLRSASVDASLQLAGLDRQAASWLTRLCTVGGTLPLGPPTSPQLLNVALYEFDNRVELLARSHGVTYTRYVDDLCLSGPDDLSPIVAELGKLVTREGFKLNATKRRDWGPGDRKTVTGIVVDTALHPEPEYVADIRRLIREAPIAEIRDGKSSIDGRIGWVAALDGRAGMSLRRALLRRLGRRRN